MGAIEENVDFVFETIFIEKFSVFPPLFLVDVPNYNLSKGLLNNVLSFVFTLELDLARTVSTAGQTANIIFGLTLRLQHIVWSKRYVFRLFNEKISHRDQKFITGSLCWTEPKFHIDGMSLTVISEIDAQGNFSAIMFFEIVLQ